MRRIVYISLLVLSAAALMAAAPSALAAGKKKTPKITRVQPMRVNVGGKLTISGRNFKAKRARNTVIFRAPSGRSAFAKPRRASRRKLVVVVPAAVARLLVGESGRQRPTRFRLRVLAGRFSKFTSRRLSPVITRTGGGRDGSGGGGTGGGGGAVAVCNAGGAGGDHDGDLLANGFEAQIKTDPCLRDTDLDGVEDGYEQQSAMDLNHYPSTPPLPYPGKRPYPNALDSSDVTTDYDGDGLRLGDEYKLWLRYSSDGVVRSGRPSGLADLLYSDGLQRSRNVSAPAPGTLLAWALDMNDDGTLRDDERDADADGLGNWDEASGRMTEAWWPAQHDGEIEPKESQYPDIDFLDNEDTAPWFDAPADSDLDGDGVLDGQDDNDHDGLSNMFEVRRPDDWIADAIVGFPTAANPWAYTNPFNPCKPFDSERCHSHPPFGYYDSDDVPPVGPDAPAGYPAGGPITPDG
jgi:hypothetical protein